MPGTATPETTRAETTRANVLATSPPTNINYPGKHNSLAFPSLCHLTRAHKRQEETHARLTIFIFLRNKQSRGLGLTGNYRNDSRKPETFRFRPHAEVTASFFFSFFLRLFKKIIRLFSTHLKALFATTRGMAGLSINVSAFKGTAVSLHKHRALSRGSHPWPSADDCPRDTWDIRTVGQESHWATTENEIPPSATTRLHLETTMLTETNPA